MREREYHFAYLTNGSGNLCRYFHFIRDYFIIISDYYVHNDISITPLFIIIFTILVSFQ